jgi:hypothetical protein
MKTISILASAAVGIAAVILVGCGGSGEENAGTVSSQLINAVGKNLPEGWNAGLAGDSGIDCGSRALPGDIVVWRTEKALLRQHGAQESEATGRSPVTLFFVLKVCPFIKPEDFPAEYKTNSEIKKQHDTMRRTVAHIPRDAKGQLAPRGDEEILAAASYNREYPKLPKYSADMPTHHFKTMAIKVWDSRPVLEPADRLVQQEMNTVFFAITKPMSSYRTQPSTK